MIKILIIIGIAVVVIVAAGIFVFAFFMKGPDLSKFEFLKVPRITTIGNRQILEVEISGTPEEILPKAFSLLYSVYFKIKDVPKGANQYAPLLRCNVPVDKPVGEYSGQSYVLDQTWKIGLPVPEGAQLPEVTPKEDMKIRITTWEYGETAEILHVGPYDQEMPTIRKLEAFVKEKGYRFRGIHEEEYLKGPGMPFSNPKDYYTIIRYTVVPD
ncbi:MAG: GyrI-like domain-containing protein [Spirochaetales bacterium]|nr:GyrI-like domain-containing protein [Spirochaetales bacterium]